MDSRSDNSSGESTLSLPVGSTLGTHNVEIIGTYDERSITKMFKITTDEANGLPALKKAKRRCCVASVGDPTFNLPCMHRLWTTGQFGRLKASEVGDAHCFLRRAMTDHSAKANNSTPQVMSAMTCAWRHHTMSVAPGTA